MKLLWNFRTSTRSMLATHPVPEIPDLGNHSSSVAKAFELGARCENLSGRRVTVMGLGRFGGGIGVVNYLLQQGAEVWLTDTAPQESLAHSLEQIDVDSLRGLTLGRHDHKDFLDCDLVVVNPAVKRDNPFLQRAADAGIPLTSEIILFCQRNPARTVAVTGSVGKSTTAALAHALLQGAGVSSYLGGNIGGTLLDLLPSLRVSDWTVLELSSFQLWDLNHLRYAPHVAVITNVFPNHLDWHGSFEEYVSAKQTIARWQNGDQFLVAPGGETVISSWPVRSRLILFGSNSVRSACAVSCQENRIHVNNHSNSSRISLDPWPSQFASDAQQSNLAAAIAAVVIGVGVPLEQCIQSVQEFKGLPHRREQAGTWHGRRFINDSKATTPQATIVAIHENIGPAGRLLLIAGGADKGIDLGNLAAEIARHVDMVVLLGATADQLESGIRRAMAGHSPVIYRASSLQSGLIQLLVSSAPGDTILLSPGCASFGEFVNYEQRGETFRNLVTAWGNELHV